EQDLVIIPELILAATFVPSGSACYRPGNLIQQCDDINGESSALPGSGGFPIQKIKPPSPAGIEDNEILLAPGCLRPFHPLAFLFLFCAQHQPAEAVRQV